MASLPSIERRLELVRKTAACQRGKDVGVLGDLQGPKIRIEKFKTQEGHAQGWPALHLRRGAGRRCRRRDPGGPHLQGSCPRMCKTGDMLVLGDGEISLRVHGGHRPAHRLHAWRTAASSPTTRASTARAAVSPPAPSPTRIARTSRLAAELGVDYLAVSFPRDAADIEQARILLQAAGGKAGIVAKIERSEAIQNLDEIILASDAVMIARGDLAVEIGDAELPGVQKHIIHRARDLNRTVITATQMMESMIHSPVPTRAEVLDVANAVHGWHRCGDALGRDRHRQISGEDRGGHGARLRRRREAIASSQRSRSAHSSSTSRAWTRPSPWR